MTEQKSCRLSLAMIVLGFRDAPEALLALGQDIGRQNSASILYRLVIEKAVFFGKVVAVIASGVPCHKIKGVLSFILDRGQSRRCLRCGQMRER